MISTFLAFFFILVLSVMILSGSQGQTSAKEIRESPNSSVNSSPGKNREELKKQLQDLSQCEPPRELSMGAMCYKPRMPANRLEYVCPDCGERTLYVQEDGSEGPARIMDWKLTGLLEKGLSACRILVKEIPYLKLELDEKELCRKCSPDTPNPGLNLLIHYPKEARPHLAKNISSEDLKLLSEFMNGKTVHQNSWDRESPLKEHIPRLQELLGVKAGKQ